MELMGIRLRLINGWHNCWRWSSIRFLGLGGAIQGALLTTPDRVLQYLPQWVLQGAALISFGCIVAAGVGRITVAEKTHEPLDPPR